MEDKKYMKKIIVLFLTLNLFISLAFSNAYASETRIDTESEAQTEDVIVESEETQMADNNLVKSEETQITEESPIESQNLYETDFEILETESDETENVITESDKKDLSIEGIEEVLGYYTFILTYDDLIQLKNAGYDISGFDENVIMAEIAGTPSVLSLPSEHDVTHVGQAAVSYSKADADKLYLFGSNSYYKNGTYTRIYGTKKRMTIGSKVYVGFCFEPSGTDPIADTVLECYRLNNRPDIVKALYYGFSGPGFESGGFKTLLDGISSSNSYFYSGGRENCYEVLTHCLIGKLYGDSAWAMGLSQESANAVITMETMLNNLPGPVDPAISLKRHDGADIKNEGTYIENGYQRTTNLVVSGDARNSLSITLPKGIEAVDGGGKVYSGTFSLNGGTAFYLRAGVNYSGTYSSGTVEGAYNISYVPYMIFGGQGTKQDCGTLFAESYSSSTSMSVIFKASTGKLTLKKISSDLSVTNGNNNYSLSGAVYGVYSDSSCTKLAGTLTTISSGTSNTLTLNAGTYYVKETKASAGYELDKTIYKAVVNGGDTTTLSVKEVPVTGSLIIKKTSSNLHLVSSNNEYSDLSATFYVYDQSGNHVKTIKTDSNGDGSIDGLALGDYTVKEIAAPVGYVLNTESQTFQITQNATSFTRTFVNDPVLGKIKITKVIHAEDINFDNGNPMFMFKVMGINTKGDQRVLYEIVDFTKDYVEAHTNNHGDVHITVEFDELIAGTYIVMEMETSRYKLEEISNIQNGLADGNNVKFVLTTKGDMEGAATFINDNYEQQNFSDSAKVINEMKK